LKKVFAEVVKVINGSRWEVRDLPNKYSCLVFTNRLNPDYHHASLGSCR